MVDAGQSRGEQDAVKAVSAVEPVSMHVNSARFPSMNTEWQKSTNPNALPAKNVPKVCPQEIIHIHECANYIVVKCSNKSKGAAAKKQCEASCIGCGICEKTCTAGAVKVTDNCAVIDEDACLSCGMCSVKCPRHVIHDLRGIFTPVR